MTKVYHAYNARKPKVGYDLRLFSEANIKEANERVEELNKRGPKGWELVVIEDA